MTDGSLATGRHDLSPMIRCESVDMIRCVRADALLKTDGLVDSEAPFAFRSLDNRESGREVDVG